MVTGSRVNQVDLYEVLGLGRECSQKELKSAFRTLARKYHPDVNPGDRIAEERFKAINLAYQTLIDPYERRAYDFAHPHAGRSGGAPPPQPTPIKPPSKAQEQPSPERAPARPFVERSTLSKMRRVGISIAAVLATVALTFVVGSQIMGIRDESKIDLTESGPPSNGPGLPYPERRDRGRTSAEILLVVGCAAAFILHHVLERTLDRREDD